MIDDTVLLWKYKHGSKDALRRIYEKYRSDLLTLAVNLLGDTNSAEDVVQDVFVSFVQSIEKFRLTGSMRKAILQPVSPTGHVTVFEKGNFDIRISYF